MLHISTDARANVTACRHARRMLKNKKKMSRFGRILGHLPAANNASGWVRMLGHHWSPFRRLGAICGVLDASLELSLDIYSQLCHNMPLMRSQVSSHDLAHICLSVRAVGRGRRALQRAPRTSREPLARCHTHLWIPNEVCIT